jgi:hypothetical protein
MDITDDIIGAESSGNPRAKADKSSALGPGQFLKNTWLDMIKRYRPDLAQGKSEAEILAMRTDPDLSRQMTAAYAAENSGKLSRAGLPVTPGSTYLMHFAGPGGGVALMKADPNTPVESILGAKVIEANPQLKGKTAGWVIAWANRRIATAAPSKSSAGPQPAPPQNFGGPSAGDARRPQAPANAVPSVAPTSFDNRFGNWPSSPQARTPVRPTAAPPSSNGGNSGFGIYKYPTENQLGFDPGALSASPKTGASPDARYLVRVPSPQTSAPARPYQPGPPRQPSPPPEGSQPLPFPVPPMVYGLPDPSTASGDDWFDRWIKPLMRP